MVVNGRLQLTHTSTHKHGHTHTHILTQPDTPHQLREDDHGQIQQLKLQTHNKFNN